MIVTRYTSPSNNYRKASGAVLMAFELEIIIDMRLP